MRVRMLLEEATDREADVLRRRAPFVALGADVLSPDGCRAFHGQS